MSSVIVKTKGLKELDRRLGGLAATIQLKGAVGMNRAAARVVEREAKKKCPVSTGNLRASIKTFQIEKGERSGKVTHWVSHTVGRDAVHDGWYAHIVEFGNIHGPYRIPKAKGQQATPKLMSTWNRAGRSGAWINETFGRRITNKTWTARPYMRPAFDENIDKILKTAAKNLERFVEKKEAPIESGS